MENIILAIFHVESQAYQAFADLKRDPYNDASLISEMAVISKKEDRIQVEERFDTGTETRDDTITGGLVGGLVGILGGPLGVILGGTFGALIGDAFDANDALKNASLIETVANRLIPGDVAIIALVQEDNEKIMDSLLAKYDVVISRWDAALIEDEVEEANQIALNMAKQVRTEMRKERSSERSAKIAGYKQRIKETFNRLKEKK